VVVPPGNTAMTCVVNEDGHIVSASLAKEDARFRDQPVAPGKYVYTETGCCWTVYPVYTEWEPRLRIRRSTSQPMRI
jgi:hypothetical protein